MKNENKNEIVSFYMNVNNIITEQIISLLKPNVRLCLQYLL